MQDLPASVDVDEELNRPADSLRCPPSPADDERSAGADTIEEASQSSARKIGDGRRDSSQVEDDIEDRWTGYSQESRDTIESWTD